MITPALRPLSAALISLLLILPPRAQAQAQQPTTEQLKSWIAIREQRVNLLRDEIKQIDARLESRLDVIIASLKSISDSKDSGTKVARMKEDTGKRLLKTINYYDQKRAALKEELRRPQLHLTADEKRRMIAVFDARIQKRTEQILALHKSMPAHKDHDRYIATAGAWRGTEYHRNKAYEQNERMTTHSNQQRDAMLKQLDISLGRLDQQSRTLKAQIAATKDSLQRKTLTSELDKNEDLISERRKQRLEILKPSSTRTQNVSLKDAVDMDRTMQTAIAELQKEFSTLFYRYNTFLPELSSLHATEAALAARRR